LSIILNSYQLQDEHLRTTKRPYAMDCYALSSRLGIINTLSAHLPGSGGAVLYATPAQLKNAYFRMMLDPWQLKFDTSGDSIERLPTRRCHQTGWTPCRLLHPKAKLRSTELHHHREGTPQRRRDPARIPVYAPWRSTQHLHRSPKSHAQVVVVHHSTGDAMALVA